MRNIWVDYAKAIGILFVVYGHVARGLHSASYIQMDESVYQFVDSFIYSFHMPLFFFLSGIFALDSLQKRGLKVFIANKVDTIFYPYVIWSILQGGMEVIFGRWTNYKTTWAEVFGLLWYPRAQFWFLYAMFFVCLVAGILYSIRRQNTIWIPLGALVYFSIRDIPQVKAVITSEYLFILGYLATYLLYFTLGIYFRRIQDFFAKHCGLLTIGLFPVFIATQYMKNQHLFMAPIDSPRLLSIPSIRWEEWGIAGNIGAMLATAAVTCVTLAWLISVCMYISKINLGRLKETLLVLGGSSMSIYLAHIVIGSGVRIVLAKFLHITDIYIHSIIGCMAGILISVILWQYAEK